MTNLQKVVRIPYGNHKKMQGQEKESLYLWPYKQQQYGNPKRLCKLCVLKDGTKTKSKKPQTN